MQRSAVCYSLLQFVAVCYSLLQFVAVCRYSPTQHSKTRWDIQILRIWNNLLRQTPHYCSPKTLAPGVLQCVAMVCSVLLCVMLHCVMCCAPTRFDTALRCSMLQCVAVCFCVAVCRNAFCVVNVDMCVWGQGLIIQHRDYAEILQCHGVAVCCSSLQCTIRWTMCAHDWVHVWQCVQHCVAMSMAMRRRRTISTFHTELSNILYLHAHTKTQK